MKLAALVQIIIYILLCHVLLQFRLAIFYSCGQYLFSFFFQRNKNASPCFASIVCVIWIVHIYIHILISTYIFYRNQNYFSSFIFEIKCSHLCMVAKNKLKRLKSNTNKRVVRLFLMTVSFVHILLLLFAIDSELTTWTAGQMCKYHILVCTDNVCVACATTNSQQL